MTVIAAELGGRWDQEAVVFVRLLGRARARAAPDGLRAATARSFATRWAAFLAVTAQRVVARLLGELLAEAVCVRRRRRP